MQGTPRTRAKVAPRSGSAVAGASAWEARRKMDEVKGGIKVFDDGGDESRDTDEEGLRVYRRLRRNQSDDGGGGRKRGNWKAPEAGGIQLRKAKSELATPPLLLISSRGKKKAADGGAAVAKGEIRDGGEQVLETVSTMDKEINGEDEQSKTENLAEEEKETIIDENHEMIVQEELKMEEKAMVVHVTDQNALDQETIRSRPPPQEPAPDPIPMNDDDRATNPDPVHPSSPLEKAVPVLETSDEIENKEPIHTPPSPSLKMDKEDQPFVKKVNDQCAVKTPNFPSPARVVKKITFSTDSNQQIVRPSPTEKKTVQVENRQHILKQDSSNYSHGAGDRQEAQAGRRCTDSGRMQRIVDLVMWRDVSKSAFVFGSGTFALISSSYAKDINFNPITAASYLGLVFLGLTFIYKSVLLRGSDADGEGEGEDGEGYVVGEDEAIRMLRLVLPYVNEVLLTVRCLFSGDPATTMKLALLLFATARCGRFVTLWTLAKLGFFGVFIVPKVCASYSTQLARYGTFWLDRFRDSWESCTHKKAVAAAVFTLIWNVSSTVARIWAVFMVVVAFKYYQQMMTESWTEEEDEKEPQEESGPAQAQSQAHSINGLHQRHRVGPTSAAAADVWRERRVRGGIQPK